MRVPGAPSDDRRSVVTGDRADGLKEGNFPQKAHVCSGGSFKMPPHCQHVESLSGRSGEVRWLRCTPAPQAQALSPGVHSADHLQVSPQPAHQRRAGCRADEGACADARPLCAQVYELPFLVALDHRKESVVVAVRGTMSLQVRGPPALCGARGCSAQSRETQLPGIRWEASVTAPAPGRWALWKSR